MHKDSDQETKGSKTLRMKIYIDVSCLEHSQTKVVSEAEIPVCWQLQVQGSIRMQVQTCSCGSMILDKSSVEATKQVMRTASGSKPAFWSAGMDQDTMSKKQKVQSRSMRTNNNYI